MIIEMGTTNVQDKYLIRIQCIRGNKRESLLSLVSSNFRKWNESFFDPLT